MARRQIIWVFAYDIVDDKMRRRVARILEDEAVRVQGSVFEGRMSRNQMRKICSRLETYLAPSDRLRVYPLPDHLIKKCYTFGGTPLPERSEFWLF